REFPAELRRDAAGLLVRAQTRQQPILREAPRRLLYEPLLVGEREAEAHAGFFGGSETRSVPCATQARRSPLVTSTRTIAVRAEEAVGDALVEMLERRLPDRHRGVAPTTVVARRASQACEVAVPRVTEEDAARDRSRRRPRRGGGRVGRDARQDAGQTDGEGGREDRRAHRTRRCADVRPQHARFLQGRGRSGATDLEGERSPDQGNGTLRR